MKEQQTPPTYFVGDEIASKEHAGKVISMFYTDQWNYLIGEAGVILEDGTAVVDRAYISEADIVYHANTDDWDVRLWTGVAS